MEIKDLNKYHTKHNIRVLAIETSCDETAVAIVEHKRFSLCGKIICERILSQCGSHLGYGGIIPEIAARLHVDCLDGLISDCIFESGYALSDMDLFAVTSGPGLVGGLLGGVVTARGLGFGVGRACLSINHLEGHALAPRLFERVDFPYLLVLLSGGHSHIYLVHGVGRYDLIGATLDDAAGEAFDKSARFLGLGSAGGCLVEKAAKKNTQKLIKLPKPLFGKKNADFSFSGLKTAFIRKTESLAPLDEDKINNLSASLEQTMSEIIVDRTKSAISICEKKYSKLSLKRVVLSGGVAANMKIRASVLSMCSERGIELFAPPLKWCGDNAAMIAWASIERIRSQAITKNDYNFCPKARWGLQEMNLELKG